jgi:hypothetical protein
MFGKACIEKILGNAYQPNPKAPGSNPDGRASKIKGSQDFYIVCAPFIFS